MARRDIFHANTDRLVVAPFNVDTGAGDVYETFANTLWNFGRSLHDEADRKVQQSATLKGIEAGDDPNFRPRRDRTIAAEAMNRAAIEVYLSNLEITTHKQMGELATRHAGDPSGLQSAVAGMAEGTEELLAKDFPEAVQPFREMLENISRPHLLAASRAQRDAIAGDTAAAVTEATTLTKTSAEHIARVAGPDPVAVASISERRARFVSKLMQHGPREAFTFNGVEMDSDPNRIPLYTSPDMEAALRQFDRSMQTQMALGGLEEAMKNGRGVRYIRNFRSIAEVRSLYDASPEELDALENELIRLMSRRQTHVDEASGRAEKERKELHRRNEQRLYADALAGEVIASDDVAEMLRFDTISAAGVRAIEKFVDSTEPLSDDPVTHIFFRLNLLDMDVRDLLTDSRLTTKTKLALFEQREQLVSDAQNWRSSDAGREAVRRISQDGFGVVPGASVGIQAKRARQLGEALTELYDRVDGLPLDQREAQAIRIAEEVVRSIKIPDLLSEADRLQNELDTAGIFVIDGVRYTTVEQVDAAIQSGDLAKNAGAAMRGRVEDQQRRINRARQQAEQLK